ncbi:response regulator transcription factor [Nesterenkonia flava]|uniref:Response regulator transcription factor n=1 Tax=Nesterenkonia flava TaxID=469799 RepID=A0ABU1FPN3_9MICC|nr:response regulator transcription factor [Nesterenkonia flava]MDR5710603.1 response regulator transcription factor [Nesterenkonia flava]
MDDRTVKVLIVDDHAVVRRGIAAYLEVVEDVQAVGEAGDGKEALEKLAELDAYDNLPDIVLLDLIMPRMDGAATLPEIRARYPQVKVVVLTSFAEPERMNTVMRLGAVGYLLKDAGPQEVASAMRAALRDEMYIDTAMTKKFAQMMNSPATGISTLTDRERTVLALVGEGRSNRQIAQELFISERTARTHVSNILRKLDLRSRTQAALLAVDAGLLASRS